MHILQSTRYAFFLELFSQIGDIMLGTFILSGFMFMGLGASTKPNYCPLLGPVFPPPTRLNQSIEFSAAVKNISTELEQAIKGLGHSELGSTLNPSGTSFAVQIFNARNQSPLFEFYHTSPAVRDYREGVRNIDENTVFKIGSNSKTITVLLLLIQKGESVFNEPVAKYIPEIRDAAASANATEKDDAIDFVQWKDVTVGELCSHLSGLDYDCELPQVLVNDRTFTIIDILANQ